MPDLLRKGFLAEVSENCFRLDPVVRHLSGMRPPAEAEKAAFPQAEAQTVPAVTLGFQFSVDTWSQWENAATPALRRHVEAVEYCSLCALPSQRVAEAFMVPARPQFFPKNTKTTYGRWKDTHPDRGPLAATYTVAFRAEHGHGPSYNQLCAGLGWDLKVPLRFFIVQRLVANDWLTNTAPVPWTLRPGQAAQARGITLPRARSSATVTHTRS